MKWAGTEIENVLDFIKSGKNYKEISEIINRSESSIRNKASEIGVTTSMYYQPKLVDISCLECGNIINSLKYENRKFCSHSCSAKFNNKLNVKIKKIKFCLNCSSEISRKYKFCSHQCNKSYNKKVIFNKIENGDITIDERQYKKYLIVKYGEKCMECGWCDTNKKTGNIPIQLEHIDGHSENNNLSNLKLLCPNCHSLTNTFGALNKGNGRKNRYKYAININKLENE